MSRRSRVNQTEEGTELNMTPMLDVVFILLIFFIVTSVFVKTPGFEPDLPSATEPDEWKPGILVAVNGEDEVWIDKTPYNIEEVRPVLISLRDQNPKATGVIQGDGDASVGTIMQLQDIMSDVGIDVRVKTEER